MSKKLMFDLTVESNALLCPNPQEWFVKATLSNEDLAEFRQLPNVKEKTKLGSLEFTGVIQEYGCEFTPTNSDLDAIDIEPCKLAVMTSICQDELESSFVADWMRAGSNNADFAPASFMSHYFDRLAAEVSNELAVIAWQGDTSGSIAPFDKCDRLEKKLAADATVIDVSGIVITASNVLAEIAKVIKALPAAIAYRTADLRLFVSSNVAQCYQIAASTLNVNQYVSEAAPLQYQGIKMIISSGMSNDTMVLTLGSNLIYAYDLLNDVSTIDTVNFRSTTLEAKIGTRTDFKFFVGLTNGDEIVFYS